MLNGKQIDPNALISIKRLTSTKNNLSKSHSSIIPIPKVQKQSKSDQEKYKKKKWKIPKFYIKNFANIGTHMPSFIDFYDPTKEDFTWVEALKKSININIIQVCKLFEYFEHFSFLEERGMNDKNNLSLTEAKNIGFIFDIKREVVSLIYDYWLKKRLKINRSLLRRYIKYPIKEDNPNYTTFRPRTLSRRTSTRSATRNSKINKSSMSKFKQLSNDFKKLSSILNLVRKREEKKREQIIYDALIFDKKINLTDFGQKVFEIAKKNNSFSKYVNIYLKTPIPYETYFKFNNDKKPSGSSKKKEFAINLYSKILRKKIKKYKTNLLKKEKLIPKDFSKSIMFRINKDKKLVIDVYYVSNNKQCLFDESIIL